VFPLLEGEDNAAAATADVLPPAESHSTITTMSGFPSWQSISMPSLVIPGLAARQASALLGVDLGRVASRQHDDYPQETAGLPREAEGNRTPPRRGKAVHRPRSYVQILEDFQAHDDDALRSAPPVMAGRADSGQSGVTDLTSDGEGEGEPAGLNAHSNPSPAALSEAEGAGSAEDALAAGSPGTSPRASVDRVGGLGSAPTTPRRKEDTVRRHKRFSMPAMALQTTPVTAKPGAGDGKKRFSLVLGRGEHGPRAATHAAGETKPSDGPRRSLGAGPAVSSLQRILSRVKD
jgi:FYVE/RhoGEF/PH domain-containing protein 5/6